jgi:1-acyl-sn-glycerol-3-phosphate acyltransferase
VIRSIWVLCVGLVLTPLFASWVVLSSWKRSPRTTCVCDKMARLWSRLLLKHGGIRVQLKGAEGVDWSQPAIVVANHQSWFDVFALLATLPGRARFVAKEELAKIPIFGRAWRVCDHISVDRSDRRRAIESLDRAAERVRSESLTMILFPEGTRSPDGRLHAFKKGAFVLALKTGVPIIPVGISGSRDVMPKGSFRVRSGEIRIRVGAPIEPGEMGHEGRGELLKRSRAAVLELMEGEDAESQLEENLG